MSEQKVTILFDTERSALSVRHLVRTPENPKGPVVLLKTPTFKQVQDGLASLKRGVVPGVTDADEIGAYTLDTITTLSMRTRMDMVSEVSDNADLWTKRGALFSQQRDWGAMSDMIFRLLLNFASLSEETGVPTVVLSHEGQRIDEGTGAKKPGPDLNNMLLSALMESVDFAWRIWKEESAQKIKFGGKDVEYPKNTHFMRMANSERFMTKTRIPRQFAETIPDPLPNPSLQAAFYHLGVFRPALLVAFGPWGAGKTTFGCSLSDPWTWEQFHKNYPQAKTAA